MKELEVTVRIRNNRLKERRLALGLTQKQMAGSVGISQAKYSDLELMRDSPVDGRSGQWTPAAVRIANFFDVRPEELFPEVVRAVVRPRMVRKVDTEDLRTFVARGNPALFDDPGAGLDRRQLTEKVGEALATLNEREEEIIRARFGIGGDGEGSTYDDLAPRYGVSKERIRQIEAKALRKLRHPRRCNALRPFVGEEEKGKTREQRLGIWYPGEYDANSRGAGRRR